MDGMGWIVFAVVMLLVGAGVVLRYSYIYRKEYLRNPRTEGLVNGKTVVEMMLKDAGIEGIAIKPHDAMIQCYYYSPSKKYVVMSTHAYYGCGYYEVMRAANLASHAVQREEAYKTIDLFLWIEPVVEWMARIIPLVLLIGLFFAVSGITLVGIIALGLWVGMLLLVIFMHPIEKDASRRSCEWLVTHGIVKVEDRTILEKTGRYLANYNLVLFLSAGFGMFPAKSAKYSDKHV